MFVNTEGLRYIVAWEDRSILFLWVLEVPAPKRVKSNLDGVLSEYTYYYSSKSLISITINHSLLYQIKNI